MRSCFFFSIFIGSPVWRAGNKLSLNNHDNSLFYRNVAAGNIPLPRRVPIYPPPHNRDKERLSRSARLY
jgi:hypothetical protein